MHVLRHLPLLPLPLSPPCMETNQAVTKRPTDRLPHLSSSMARAHPTSDNGNSMISTAFLFHAAWITAAVAVCLALCTNYSRNRKPSFSSRRRRSSSSSSCSASRESVVTKVSPTPSDTPKAAANGGGLAPAASEPARGADDDAGSGPVTVIDVGTHGPLAPVFLLPPDPIPPRRSLSLSAKHVRFAERLGRIRSMRRGSGETAAATTASSEDDVFVGLRGGDAADDRTLWTKTIILGERCRVPSGHDDGDGAVPWKSYRPRQPRSVPVTRSNSFAGIGACKRADEHF